MNMTDTNTFTLALALDRIVGEISSSTLDTYLESEHPELTFACETLDISPLQAALFAVILEKSGDDLAITRDLVNTLSISKIRLLGFKKELDELAAKRLVVVRKRRGGSVGYRVSQSVVKAVQNNTPVQAEPMTGLSTRSIFSRMHTIFADLAGGLTSADIARHEIYDLMNSNTENPFVQSSLRLGLQNLNDSSESLLMFYMLHRNVSFNDNEFDVDEFRRILDDPMGINDSLYELIGKGESQSHTKGWIEFKCEGGLENRETIQVNENVLNELLADLGDKGSKPRTVIPKDELIAHSSIKAKSMFYNDEEGEQINRLTELLMPEKFAHVQERLREKGRRSGICALFYGGPGVGKTETIRQIAKATGRDIYMVDMAIKSKWIGESERNLKQIFKTYRSLVRDSEVPPILLFNEADAIFGRRLVEESGSEKLNNTLQNIILQEMEDLEGILIATTNMTESFDPAFERRFLYKVLFKKPTTVVKAKIWKSMVDDITDSDAESLAAEYSFTGGQIENITRKLDVDYILYGTSPDLEKIHFLCKSEGIRKENNRKAIGF
ncbi:MAG: AAA family ATPase [Bacteroidales bacterium]|nr:AAA family ATPase [Bacteroidales bacterium]